MGHITSRVKFLKYFLGLTIETKKNTFEFKVILGLESTYTVERLGVWVGGLVGKILTSLQLG